MSKVEISAGKLRRITKLADTKGRFKMMAIDQRGSMQKALAEALNVSSDNVSYEQVAEIKTLITRVLAPYATAVLTDPIFGYPYSIMELPRDIATLLAVEKSGYVDDGIGENERASTPIDGWTVEKALRSGADAIKLLVYYHPDASPEACAHQQDYVRQVGEACEAQDAPFLLEPVSYALDGGSTNRLEFARQKPDLVIRSVEEFTQPEYKVDILKLEFPANLKFCSAYSDRDFYAGESSYDLDQVKDFCRRLDVVSTLPWVILSAGVDIEEFIEDVKLATEAGASGFLCGRAIWKEAVPLYPDIDAVTEFLTGEAAENFKNSNAAVQGALPWFDHKKFGGLQQVRLSQQGENWYADYNS